MILKKTKFILMIFALVLMAQEAMAGKTEEDSQDNSEQSHSSFPTRPQSQETIEEKFSSFIEALKGTKCSRDLLNMFAYNTEGVKAKFNDELLFAFLCIELSNEEEHYNRITAKLLECCSLLKSKNVFDEEMCYLKPTAVSFLGKLSHKGRDNLFLLMKDARKNVSIPDEKLNQNLCEISRRITVSMPKFGSPCSRVSQKIDKLESMIEEEKNFNRDYRVRVYGDDWKKWPIEENNPELIVSAVRIYDLKKEKVAFESFFGKECQVK